MEVMFILFLITVIAFSILSLYSDKQGKEIKRLEARLEDSEGYYKFYQNSYYEERTRRNELQKEVNRLRALIPEEIQKPKETTKQEEERTPIIFSEIDFGKESPKELTQPIFTAKEWVKHEKKKREYEEMVKLASPEYNIKKIN